MDPKREEPDKDYLFGSWGYDTISYRTYDAKIYLDNNPIADHCLSHVNILLLKKTDTDIVIKTISEQTGMPYADRFRIENKWDIFTPDPKSQ